MFNGYRNCEMCGGTTEFLGTLGTLNHFRCRACGWDQSDEAEAEPEISDDPYGGDDSRADADLLSERDGYDEPPGFDDDPANFAGEEF